MVSLGQAEQSGPAAIPNIVVVGASLGGLQALTRILSGLPVDLPAAIIVVQHLSPDLRSRLPAILDSYTDLAVTEARSGEKIEASHVYVAPPDQHLTINRYGRLMLNSRPKVNYSRPSVDPLFESAAEHFGGRVTAVILTGFGSDGTTGVSAVHNRGGIVIAQDEATSASHQMPASAIATGHVDYILPIGQIAAKIVELASPKPKTL